MPETTSLSFPNMFNLTSNQVAVDQDLKAVTTRCRLLILTEPSELYNNLDFGVGLRRHLWKYNTENERALIKDRIVAQLRLHEPDVLPEQTQFTAGLLFSGDTNGLSSATEANEVNMTVALQTTFGKSISLDLNSSQDSGKLTINSQGWTISEA